MNLKTFFTYVIEFVVGIILIFALYMLIMYSYRKKQEINASKITEACHCTGKCCNKTE